MRRGGEIGLVAEAAVAYYLTLQERAALRHPLVTTRGGARFWATDLRLTP